MRADMHNPAAPRKAFDKGGPARLPGRPKVQGGRADEGVGRRRRAISISSPPPPSIGGCAAGPAVNQAP